MTDGDLVPMQCSREILGAIAGGLSRFGRAEGEPDWLVSGVWLCTTEGDFLVTSFTNVLSDGYVARTLNIHSPDALSEAVDAALPDIEGRLRSRGSRISLPPAASFSAPEELQWWEEDSYSTTVLVRVSERLLTTHRVACGLLFESASGRVLLVGTDSSTMAMVLSEDEELIGRFRSSCQELPAAEFSGFA